MATKLMMPSAINMDQYADGIAADIWTKLIGDQSKRTGIYKKFLLDLLRKHNCRRILDVACGTGVDSVWLLEEGFEVTSIDASEKMLKHAYKIRWIRRKEPAFDQWEIREANWLTVADDIADLRGPGYDAVICLGNSFAHLLDNYGDLREQKRAIKNFESCLCPNGLLIIDHRNYEDILSWEKLTPTSIYYGGDILIDISTSVLYAKGQPETVILDYTADKSIIQGGDSYHNHDQHEITNFRLFYYPHTLKIFTSILREIFNGDSLHKIFGDFKPLGEISKPGYYIHVIEKGSEPETRRNGSMEL